MKPRIVISGVNFTEAGPLTVFRDAIATLAAHFAERYEIVALVHSRALFLTPNVTYLEYPQTKTSWLRRLQFEYRTCMKLSQQWRPHLWLAMHDITPAVLAPIRVVYCHNPAPFYKFSFAEARLDWRFGLFTLFYRFLYRINLRSNNFVIVQQDWLRTEFRRRYQVQNVVVAHPHIEAMRLPDNPPDPSRTGVRRFFYPAFPRTFKNVEVLLEAARLLELRGRRGFEIWLTLAGNENAYSRSLFVRYCSLTTVRWLGLLPRAEVIERYSQADCLVFPSRLETWGMPISEFKQTGRPMMVADLPYAHETVGDYPAIHFFPPSSPDALAALIERSLENELPAQASTAAPIAAPFAPDWRTLFELLLGESHADSADAATLPSSPTRSLCHD